MIIKIRKLSNDETRAQERAEAKAFLAATDWMVARSIEQGKPLDREISEKRAQARAKASTS